MIQKLGSGQKEIWGSMVATIVSVSLVAAAVVAVAENQSCLRFRRLFVDSEKGTKEKKRTMTMTTKTKKREEGMWKEKRGRKKEREGLVERKQGIR